MYSFGFIMRESFVPYRKSGKGSIAGRRRFEKDFCEIDAIFLFRLFRTVPWHLRLKREKKKLKTRRSFQFPDLENPLD